ncbi:MAG: glycosyltransferase family 2 protein [Candidatus Melainabacteria bacterium]|nr:MAG: glycosyltransferase family 2 protein [Candidatus Melainabacteria bacterium]
MPFNMLEVVSVASGVILFVICLILIRREAMSQNALYQLDAALERQAIEQFGKSNGFSLIERITLIIPALNECDNLKELLPRVPRHVNGETLGLLLIDDGSSDGTADLARSYDFTVVSTPQRGQGAALRLGYRLAVLGKAEIVVIMDADGQNRPEEIEGLIQPILADTADYVIGSRILGDFEKDDPMRRLGVRFFSPLTSFLTGTKITDCSSGFRAMKIQVLANIVGRLRQRQYSMSELNFEVARSGFRITEVPITFLKRYSGMSKKGHNLFYAFAFTRVIISTWLRTMMRKRDAIL